MAEPSAIAELERHLLDNPDDVSAHLVYADALQQRGDPRGALIALQHRRSLDVHDGSLAKAEAELLASHPELLGELAGLGTFTWRFGFIDYASMYRRSAADVETVLEHRSCRRLRELALDLSYGETIPAVEAIGSAWRPNLRALLLQQYYVTDGDGDDWVQPRHDHHSVDRVWPQLPRLHKLELRAWDLFSTIAHDELAEIVISDGNPFCWDSKGPWRLPALAKLTWAYATDLTGTGTDVDPEYLEWLWRADLPALRHVDLTGTRCASWVTQPILDVEPLRTLVGRLETFRIGAAALGETGDEILETLTRHHSVLSKLDELGVLTDEPLENADEVAAAFPQLRWL